MGFKGINVLKGYFRIFEALDVFSGVSKKKLFLFGCDDLFKPYRNKRKILTFI